MVSKKNHGFDNAHQLKAETLDTTKNLSRYNAHTDSSTEQSYVCDGRNSSESELITPKKT